MAKLQQNSPGDSETKTNKKFDKKPEYNKKDYSKISDNKTNIYFNTANKKRKLNENEAPAGKTS
jgi:hypothetical protein